MSWSFLEVLAASAFCGLLTYFVFRTIRRKRLRIVALVVVGSITGLMTCLLSAVVLEFGRPVASDEIAAHRQDFRLDFGRDPNRFTQPTEQWGFNLNPQQMLSPTYSLDFAYLDTVKKNEDFTLYVTATSASHALGQETYDFLLSVPESVKARTSYRCATNTVLGQAAACGQQQGSTVKVAWDLTFTKPAKAVLVITVPNNVIDSMTADPKWVAIPSYSNRVIMRSARRSPFSAWRGGDPRDDLVPFLLSSRVPYVSYEGFEADLRSRQFRLPTEAAETIGVSARTYTVLTWIGSIISGLLGTGWLWQLMTLRNKKPIENRIILDR